MLWYQPVAVGVSVHVNDVCQLVQPPPEPGVVSHQCRPLSADLRVEQFAARQAGVAATSVADVDRPLSAIQRRAAEKEHGAERPDWSKADLRSVNNRFTK